MIRNVLAILFFFIFTNYTLAKDDVMIMKLKNGKVKIQFAIAKGRKLWDKRNYKKDQDVNREIDRAMKDIK